MPQLGSDTTKGSTAIASDGKYLYIHNRSGLHKVGSGYGGTIKVSSVGIVVVVLDDSWLMKFVLKNEHENEGKCCKRVKSILVELDLEEMYNSKCKVDFKAL